MQLQLHASHKLLNFEAVPKVKMSQIVSSNSFHYFKNQFIQEEVPISEKMKCYDVALWPLATFEEKKAGIKYSVFREILFNE